MLRWGRRDFFILLLHMNNGKTKKKLCPIAQQFFDLRIEKYFYSLKFFKNKKNL